MPDNESLSSEIAKIRQMVEDLDKKVDHILLIMEAFTELQDGEYDSEDDEEDFDSNEGWITNVEWFADNEEDDDI